MTERLTNDSLDMDVKGSGHTLYQGIIPPSDWRTKESMKWSRYSGQDSKQASHKYMAEALTPQLTCLVVNNKKLLL
jgi:hypothetical protein